MSCTLITFSPTGGTERAARLLCEGLGGIRRTIDLTAKRPGDDAVVLLHDELTVLAMPSYGGRIPALAAERTELLLAQETPCVLLCVYGNRAYEDALVEMEDLAHRSGFRVIAAVAAVAEHSILRQFAAGRPDEEDEQALQDIAVRILAKLESGEKHPFPIPGCRPYKKVTPAGLVPHVEAPCVDCSHCAEVCPADAIDPASPRHTDRHRCISCMRCVTVCPHSARRVNGAMLSAVGLMLKKTCTERRPCELYL